MKSTNPADQFNTEIAQLIDEIESCMSHRHAAPNREFDYQAQAFQERRHLAEEMQQRLAEDSENHLWKLRSGDAHRLRQALKHSLAYFRNQQA